MSHKHETCNNPTGEGVICTVGVSRIDEPVMYTRGAAALCIFITAFMTWAALT